MSKVEIKGLSKAEVLAALFNASAPQGLGFLQSGYGPNVMTIEDAEEIIESGQTYFDYLAGRPLKTDLSEDSFDPWGFDRDNGGDGAAQKVIDRLRNSKDVNPEESQRSHEKLLQEKASQAMEISEAQSHFGGNSELSEKLKTSITDELKR